MRRRKRTRTEQEKLKNAKKMHRKEQRLNPTWFEAQRVDMASEIVVAVAKMTPRWGGFTFKFKEVGKPTTIINYQ